MKLLKGMITSWNCTPQFTKSEAAELEILSDAHFEKIKNGTFIKVYFRGRAYSVSKTSIKVPNNTFYFKFNTVQDIINFFEKSTTKTAQELNLKFIGTGF